MCSRRFFTSNKDVISGVSAIVGILVAIGGFAFTVYQIKQTGNQIERATEQLQASNEYMIRRDLRALLERLQDNVHRECVIQTETDSEVTRADPSLICTEYEEKQTKIALGLIFNFHYSVFQQARANGISEKFRDQMADDFCRWFQSDFVANFWNSQIESGNYTEERDIMRKEWCQ